MRVYDIIQAKRDGKALSEAQIRFLVEGYTAGRIPDYQMSAFCMAVYFRGMTPAETAALTQAMAESGDMVDLSMLGSRTVDKHSTGGVGDKTTLIVVPIAACLGGVVAKMSGRGLGHTGGTVDKLESIPGYETQLPPHAFLRQAEEVGAAVVGQSGDLAPADKKIYALRDVTATVESAPLIASSIMSKKLAAGAHNIVLDVKVGSGAFMKQVDDARALAQAMVEIGTACGRRMSAVLTDMDTPLGSAIGNALEVQEAIAVLRGEGPADLREVCLCLAAEMAALVNGWTAERSRQEAEQALQSGAALEKFREWIAAQGGDARITEDPSLLVESAYRRPLLAEKDGYVTGMDTEAVGKAAAVLGAGRQTTEDTIDHSAGILLCRKTGDAVRRGEVLAYLHTNAEEKLEEAMALLRQAYAWSDTPADRPPLILDIIRM